MNSTATPSSPSARPRTGRRLLALTIGLVVALVGAELVVRVFDARAGLPASPEALRGASLEIVEQMTEIEVGDGQDTVLGGDPTEGQEEDGVTEELETEDDGADDGADDGPDGARGARGAKRQTNFAPKTTASGRITYALHPYCGYVTSEGFKLIDRAVNFFESDEADDTFTVLVLGGSVAANWVGWKKGARDEIEELLRGRPELEGKRPQIMRFAVAGYRQPQQFFLLSYLLMRGCRPNVVVNLDGLNEVRIAGNNAIRGLSPTWPSVGHWLSLLSRQEDAASFDLRVELKRYQLDARDTYREALDKGLFNSVLLGRGVHAKLQRLRKEWSRTQERLTELQLESQRGRKTTSFGERSLPDDPVVAAVDCWREASWGIHLLCQSYGIRYMHLLQPTLHDRGSKRVITERERAKGLPDDEYDERVLQGYDLLRAGIANLVERGVEAYDITKIFEDVEDTLYYDSCHVNKQGSVMMGERLVELMMHE